MTQDPAPKLSVVVVASNGLEALERTLRSLKGQADSPDTEVVVVSNFDERVEARLKAQFTSAKAVVAPKDATVTQLRARGISESHGEIVAFIEDYGFVDNCWCAGIKRTHESRYAVVGGAVENGSPNKLLNWAVYFFDYGKYMLPAHPGVVPALSGINISYKRQVLNELQADFRIEFHETLINERLKARGHELYLAPTAIVFLSRDYQFGETFSGFFALARSFASERVARDSAARRISLALGSCLLPVLLPLRVVLSILPKRRHLSKLIFCFPLLVILMASWAAGEFCGYLFQSPSRS